MPVVKRVRILGPSPPAGRRSQVHGRPTRQDNHASHAHGEKDNESQTRARGVGPDPADPTTRREPHRLRKSVSQPDLLSRGKGKMDVIIRKGY